jgi:peptide-methionine (S)-S-oxide reductase
LRRYRRSIRRSWYYQNYLARHTDQPYIVYDDLPKVAHLRKQFPDLYQ